MRTEKQLRNLIPFKPGDARINRSGPPKTFYQLREHVQELLQEPALDKNGKPVLDTNGQPLTNLDMLLRKWLKSDDPRLPIRLLEIAFGKVPDRISVTDEDGRPRQFQIIEVVKDRGDSVDTMRVITTSPTPPPLPDVAPTIDVPPLDATTVETDAESPHMEVATAEPIEVA